MLSSKEENMTQVHTTIRKASCIKADDNNARIKQNLDLHQHQVTKIRDRFLQQSLKHSIARKNKKFWRSIKKVILKHNDIQKYIAAKKS